MDEELMDNHEASELQVAPQQQRDHIRGRIDARMTLVEYGDYQCPYCGAAYETTEALIELLGDDLCFVYRHFPLTQIHPRAAAAAESAEAASAQHQFWAMHDLLYRNQGALEDEDLLRYAKQLKLNVRRFIDDLEQDVYAERVLEDIRSGEQSGVDGTPTFFVNGVRYQGAEDVQSLAAALRQTA